MTEDKIPQLAIEAIAQHINSRTNKQYGIPVIGNTSNIETPQIFEIVPFDQIDSGNTKVFAIDGSYNSHSFYNGLSIGLYRAGYICFQSGKQVRVNDTDDPVILGVSYMPDNILVTSEEHLYAIYDELLTLVPVKNFVAFLLRDSNGETWEDIFPYTRDSICVSLSTLLSFCQEILEWSLIFEICTIKDAQQNDIIFRDGTLRSLNIKQKYLIKLGILAHNKGIIVVAITKNSPIKLELTYSFRQIDNYLQEELKPRYPFFEKNPNRQKLCCWLDVPESVLMYLYRWG